MKSILVILLLGISVAVISAQENVNSTDPQNTYERADHDTRWKKYKIQFKLKFASQAEEVEAFKNFIENREKVWDHRDNINDTYRKEVNRYAVMSKDQFMKSMMSLKPEKRPEVKSFFPRDLLRQSVPASFDARNIPGAVTYVRNQGDCGGCWAFSTVATLETIFALKYNRTFKFSEQHLIDCDGFNDGCDGGVMDTAFNYIKNYNGINAEKLYPYQENRIKCRAEVSQNRPVIITKVTGFPSPKKEKPAVIEEMMRVVVATHGAVAVGIDAERMQFYGGGVFTGPCTIGINHGVTVVGYGTCDKTGLDYWVIKNSWGQRWGDAGFLLLQRGNNTCGVAQMPSAPILVDDLNFTGVKTDEQIDKES